MTKKILFCLMTAALVTASAATTHRVTLFQPSVIGGKQLKPGDYKLELNDAKVVISKGKESVEAQVKVESADSKFSSTSVRYINGDGKARIQEIRLGGTNTRLVFN